jgi:mono/diheme cytochrome c family protein
MPVGLAEELPGGQQGHMRLVAALLVVVLTTLPAWADGAATFRARCGSCHGETGRADSMEARALKVPPLKDYKRLSNMTAAEIAAAVRRNPKHAGVTQVSDADLLEAAGYVTQLVLEAP